MKFNIAIDGPSAAGKSTIANLIAKKYNLVKLDTGAMYRAVGYLVYKNNLDVEDEESVLSVFNNLKLHYLEDGTMVLNDEVINDQIRNDNISLLASSASKHLKVREKLVKLQQDIASDLGYVLEGRDIGTVVLPNALVKVYLEGDVSVRAARRHAEYINKGLDVDLSDIEADIKKRDHQDINREHSPLKKADDAIAIDVTNLNIDEVILAISQIVDEKLGVIND